MLLEIVSSGFVAVACTIVAGVAASVGLRRPDGAFRKAGWLVCALFLALGVIHALEAARSWAPAAPLAAVGGIVVAALAFAAVGAVLAVAPRPMHRQERDDELRAEIMARELAVEAQRNSEALYQSLVQTLPLGVFRKDLEGSFTFGNKAFCNALGAPIEEIVGKTDYDFFPQALAEKYRGDDRYVIDTGQVKEDIEEHRSPAGDRMYVHVVKAPVLDHTGTIIGAQGIFWDVTARKIAEEQLRETAAELERSNRELEQFASIASHDLQEPLRKIQAFGDRLATKCGDALTSQGRDYLERMQNAAARMRTLINDLLTFSRVTTRAQPRADVALADVVRDVCSDLEIRIEQTGARVEVGDLPTVQADPTQMRQVFQNLIGNALKFRREGEPPHVRIGAERRADAGADEPYVITVRDNGIGFEEKHADRIFGIFQRLHGRGEYEGTGIGLAVVQKIVERHGGTITAESTPGQGATFRVSLPAHRGT